MIYIDNDVINLTRGDDATLTASLTNDDDSEYVMSNDEYLIFGVRVTPEESSELLLELRSDPGSNIISFSHDDTAGMEVGFYSAELQLMVDGGKRATVWPKLKGGSRTGKANWKNFCLMAEVVME